MQPAITSIVEFGLATAGASTISLVKMKKQKIPTIIFWLIFTPALGLSVWIYYGLFTTPKIPAASESERCRTNISNFQLAVREYEQQHGLKPGDELSAHQIIDAGILVRMPNCPSNSQYKLLNHIPDRDELYLLCPDPSHNPNHINR